MTRQTGVWGSLRQKKQEGTRVELRSATQGFMMGSLWADEGAAIHATDRPGTQHGVCVRAYVNE